MYKRDIDRKRETWRKHYKNNSKKYMLKSRDLTRTIREFIRWVKEGVPCKDCKVSYPYYVMQFDHINPSEKSGTIDYMVSNYGKAKIFNEMLKCEIVCANCHAVRTYKQNINGDIAQLGEQLLCKQ